VQGGTGIDVALFTHGLVVVAILLDTYSVVDGQWPKILPFGKAQARLALRSLNRIFHNRYFFIVYSNFISFVVL